MTDGFAIDASASMAEKMFASFGLVPDERVGAILAAVDADARYLASDFAPATHDESDAIAAYERDFLSRFTFHSTVMEGSTLSPAETELVLEGEFIPSDDKSLQDLFSVRGCAEGYDYAQRRIEAEADIDVSFICDVHERTALDGQPRARGSLRRIPVFIRGSETTPVAPAKVPEEMERLVYLYEESKAHPLVAAAAFHAMFENIHPFVDGNGRTGRILLNVMLVRAGYPPIAIKSDARAGYLTALEDWQVRGNPAPLVELVCDCVARETQAHKEVIEQVRECAQLNGKA